MDRYTGAVDILELARRSRRQGLGASGARDV